MRWKLSLLDHFCGDGKSYDGISRIIRMDIDILFNRPQVAVGVKLNFYDRALSYAQFFLRNLGNRAPAGSVNIKYIDLLAEIIGKVKIMPDNGSAQDPAKIPADKALFLTRSSSLLRSFLFRQGFVALGRGGINKYAGNKYSQ